jgi:hypothetical protein
VLLWGIATLFSNCLAGMPFILYDEARKKRQAGKPAAAAGCLLGSLLSLVLWLGLVGYCGYRAYRAIP